MKALDLDLHFFAQVFIKRGQRFIHQKNTRRIDDRAGQCDTLLLPTGELFRTAIGEICEPHAGKRLAGDTMPLLFWHTTRFEWESHIVEYTHVGKQRVMLKHHTNIALMRRNARIVVATEQDTPLIGALKPGQHHEDCRFSGTRRPKQGEKFTRCNLHIEIVNSRKASIALPHTLNADAQPGIGRAFMASHAFP